MLGQNDGFLYSKKRLVVLNILLLHGVQSGVHTANPRITCLCSHIPRTISKISFIPKYVFDCSLKTNAKIAPQNPLYKFAHVPIFVPIKTASSLVLHSPWDALITTPPQLFSSLEWIEDYSVSVRKTKTGNFVT